METSLDKNFSGEKLSSYIRDSGTTHSTAQFYHSTNSMGKTWSFEEVSSSPGEKKMLASFGRKVSSPEKELKRS